MLKPWLFGDEYIYISKARNIRRGISVLADASMGHKYPPLYSYLLSLAVSSDPDTTYRNIQLLNLGVSQALIAGCFIFLNQVFGWSGSKKDLAFTLFAWVLTASLPLVTGYYFVAMSENLYLPLILIIFCLLVWLGERQKVKPAMIVIISTLSALAILTRAIGLALVPSLVLTFLAANISKALQKKQKLSKQVVIQMVLQSALIIIISLGVAAAFNFVESLFVTESMQQAAQQSYSPNSYLRAMMEFITLKSRWFDAFKITGNHLIYLFYSSFFFPLLFLINDLIKLIKNKQMKLESWFIVLFGLFSFGLSFLHCYLGFKNRPIHYSTYLRYFDPTVLVIFVYGLLRAKQLISRKLKLNKAALAIFALLSLLLIVMLPEREFYVRINSLGWGYLDLVKNQQWLIKPLSMLAVSLLLTALMFKKKLLTVLGVVVLSLNLLTINVHYQMQRWLAGVLPAKLDQPISSLIEKQQITDFYYLEDKLLSSKAQGELYYLKYHLLFANNKRVPIVKIEREELAKRVANNDKLVVVTLKDKAEHWDLNFDQLVEVDERLELWVSN